MADSQPHERPEHDEAAEPGEPEDRKQTASAEAGKASEDRQKREAEDRREQSRRTARPWVRLGMVAVLAVLIGGGIWYWLATKDLETTDDAYTDGRAIAISSHVTGTVFSLDVNDNQFVHAGDPLIHIDPRDYQAALLQAQGQLAAAEGQLAAQQHAFEIGRVNFPARLQQAQAQLKDAQANLFKAQTDYRRQQSLPRGATTGQQIDYATAALRSAEAQVASSQAAVLQATPVQPNIQQIGSQVRQISGTLDQARGAVRQAELNLYWCVIRSPQDGWITKRNVEQGNYVQQGMQVFNIVSPDVWITGNFKETQLARMRPGQHVKISVDAYPNLKLEGHVDSLQLGSGSKFTAFPPENATGNFVKIVQRVPVKIVIDSGLDPNLPLPLGVSVEPTVQLK